MADDSERTALHEARSWANSAEESGTDRDDSLTHAALQFTGATAWALISIAESLATIAARPSPEVAVVLDTLRRERDVAVMGSGDDSLNGDLAAARARGLGRAVELLEGAGS